MNWREGWRPLLSAGGYAWGFSRASLCSLCFGASLLSTASWAWARPPGGRRGHSCRNCCLPGKPGSEMMRSFGSGEEHWWVGRRGRGRGVGAAWWSGLLCVPTWLLGLVQPLQGCAQAAGSGPAGTTCVPGLGCPGRPGPWLAPFLAQPSIVSIPRALVRFQRRRSSVCP